MSIQLGDEPLRELELRLRDGGKGNCPKALFEGEAGVLHTPGEMLGDLVLDELLRGAGSKGLGHVHVDLQFVEPVIGYQKGLDLGVRDGTDEGDQHLVLLLQGLVVGVSHKFPRGF